MNTVEQNGILYIPREDGTAAVKQYPGKEQFAEIPETVEGCPVTEILDQAFFNAPLRKIRIPAGVTRIADVVFPVRMEVDEEAMQAAQAYFDSRYGHNASLPRYCHYDREEFESAEMATHMVVYKYIYDVTVIAEQGSCAQRYCEKKEIPVVVI